MAVELQPAVLRRRSVPARVDGRQVATLVIVVVGLAATISVAETLANLAALADSRGRLYLWDLEVYRTAGQWLLDGRSPFDPTFGEAVLGVPIAFSYAPLAAVLCIPLTWMPSAVAPWVSLVVAWILPGAVLTWVCFRRFMTARPRWTWGVLLAAVLASTPAMDVMSLGQIGMVVTALVMLDLAGPEKWFRRTRLPRGVLAGLAGAVKLVPLVAVVHLVVTRQWTAARNAVATVAVFWGVGWVLLPADSTWFFLHGGMFLNPVGQADHAVSPENQSLVATAMRITGISPLPFAVWTSLAALVCLVGLLAARSAHRHGNALAAATLVGLTSMLASPISWVHHTVWLVAVPGVILAEHPLRDAHGSLTRWGSVALAFFFLLFVPAPAAAWSPLHAWGVTEWHSVLAVVGGWMVWRLAKTSPEVDAPGAPPGEAARSPLSTSSERYFREAYDGVMYTGAVGAYSRFVHRVMERPFIGSTMPLVVELGAGAGQHAPFVRGTVGRYVESDLDPVLGATLPARTTGGGTPVERAVLDATDLSELADDSVDRIVATCLLTHLDHPERALNEWRRVVKPGGWITIYVACEPGMLLRLARALIVVPKSRRHGQDHLSTVYRDHRNHFPLMRAVLRTVFGDDRVRRVRFPLPFLSWNFALFDVYQVQVAGSTTPRTDDERERRPALGSTT